MFHGHLPPHSVSLRMSMPARSRTVCWTVSTPYVSSTSPSTSTLACVSTAIPSRTKSPSCCLFRWVSLSPALSTSRRSTSAKHRVARQPNGPSKSCFIRWPKTWNITRPSPPASASSSQRAQRHRASAPFRNRMCRATFRASCSALWLGTTWVTLCKARASTARRLSPSTTWTRGSPPHAATRATCPPSASQTRHRSIVSLRRRFPSSSIGLLLRRTESTRQPSWCCRRGRSSSRTDSAVGPLRKRSYSRIKPLCFTTS
mmetsp:Transcript_56935/g.123768  ORF Transcript_56935/g.123768 Transcript_56935/m.123768 type:complete len:259 (+) Transcript_56935:36-812(+)